MKNYIVSLVLIVFAFSLCSPNNVCVAAGPDQVKVFFEFPNDASYQTTISDDEVRVLLQKMSYAIQCDFTDIPGSLPIGPAIGHRKMD